MQSKKVKYYFHLRYTACSRDINLLGLHIIAFHPDAIFASKECIEEYNRIKKDSGLPQIEGANIRPYNSHDFPKKQLEITVAMDDYLEGAKLNAVTY